MIGVLLVMTMLLIVNFKIVFFFNNNVMNYDEKLVLIRTNIEHNKMIKPAQSVCHNVTQLQNTKLSLKIIKNQVEYRC